MTGPRFPWLGALLMLWLGLPAAAGAQSLSPFGNPVITVRVREVPVAAEVVSTPDKIYLGLGYRASLAPGQGMLFVMPTLEQQHFCMRGMQFPLDFLWLSGHQVAGLHKNVAADFPGVISSPVPVKYVLEVPAGFIDRHGIGVGDPVTFRW